MIKINAIKIARHFYLYEFACPCCNRVILHSDLLKRLVSLRISVNRPVYINSGYRCQEENKRAGGTKNSYHLLGMAADIRVTGMNPRDLAIYAEGAGFLGIGIYADFCHLDVRPGKYFWEGKE